MVYLQPLSAVVPYLPLHAFAIRHPICRIARTIRGSVLAIREREFVQAARALGSSDLRLLVRHIFPNVVNPLVVIASFELAKVIIYEASLSFLGLGIQPPFADWGSMVRDNAQAINFGGIAPLIPTTAIAQLTIGVNLLVDWFLSLHSPGQGKGA